MKKYIILSSRNVEMLSERVNDEISRGYIPQGGVTTSFSSVDTSYNYTSGGLTRFKPDLTFYQAMILQGYSKSKGFE